jgi:hypothetical protein
VTTPPSQLLRPWNGEGEAIWTVPLLRAKGGEKEPQVGLVATEDGRPTEAEAMILQLSPDEALVVDVARGLDSGIRIEQAHVIFVKAFHGVGWGLCRQGKGGGGAQERGRETFITGAVDLLKQHSGIVWHPRRFVGSLRGKDATRSGTRDPAPPQLFQRGCPDAPPSAPRLMAMPGGH